MKPHTIKVVVPNSNQGKDHRKVFMKGRSTEMLIHSMCTLQQPLKVVVSNNQANRKTDGTPQAVTAPNPIPELEHILLGNPKLSNSLRIRAQRHKVFRNMRLVLCALEEPRPRRLGISDSLLSRECLAGDDEEGGLGITFAEFFSEVRSVDVGYEMGFQVAFGVSFESFGDHDGT